MGEWIWIFFSLTKVIISFPQTIVVHVPKKLWLIMVALFLATDRSINEKPTIISSPQIQAIIGTRYTVCVVGDVAGSNGTTFWTVDGVIVNAIDVSDQTNPGNSDAVNYASPICEMCSCNGTYLNEGAIQNLVDQELEQSNFAAFIVHMFVMDGTVGFNFRGRLCYGVPNKFLSVLVMKVTGRERKVNVGFTVVSAMNKSNTGRYNGTIGECLHDS